MVKIAPNVDIQFNINSPDVRDFRGAMDVVMNDFDIPVSSTAITFSSDSESYHVVYTVPCQFTEVSHILLLDLQRIYITN